MHIIKPTRIAEQKHSAKAVTPVMLNQRNSRLLRNEEMRKVAGVKSVRRKLLQRKLFQSHDTISYYTTLILRVLVIVGTSKT